jgi:hypothetical protein
MRYGVQVDEVQQGGSTVVQEIVISSESKFRMDLASGTSRGYFKLVYNSNDWGKSWTSSSVAVTPITYNGIYEAYSKGSGSIVITEEGSAYTTNTGATNSLPEKGFNFGVSAATLEAAIIDALGNVANDGGVSNTASIVRVTRSGFGSEEEGYTYKYQVTFSNANRMGLTPTLSVLGDRQVSAPLFIPANQTTSQADLWQLNDLVVSGNFSNSVRDVQFMVQIAAAAVAPASGKNASLPYSGLFDKFQFKTCYKRPSVGTSCSATAWSATFNITAGQLYTLTDGITIDDEAIVTETDLFKSLEMKKVFTSFLINLSQVYKMKS